MNTYIFLHDLDPFIVKFPTFIREYIGLMGIRWYGMSYLAGFLFGYLILRWMMRRNLIQFDNEEALDFVVLVALYGVIGGRIGYVLLYGMNFWMNDPLYIIKIWQGGMSIHGGIIGAILGITWFSRKHDCRFFKLGDVAALGTPPGLFFGRIANFVNGELWGRPTDGSWGVIFPAAPGEHIPRHPSQLYEAILEGPVLFLMLLWIALRFKRTGMISAAFLSGYGLFRFLIEFYRAPDPHIGYEILGMTRGQEYSIIFIMVGIGVYFYNRNQPQY